MCVKKVAYVCGGGEEDGDGEDQTADVVDSSSRSMADAVVVEGVIPNLDLSVVEEAKEDVDSSTGTTTDSVAVVEGDSVVVEDDDVPVVVTEQVVAEGAAAAEEEEVVGDTPK